MLEEVMEKVGLNVQKELIEQLPTDSINNSDFEVFVANWHGIKLIANSYNNANFVIIKIVFLKEDLTLDLFFIYKLIIVNNYVFYFSKMKFYKYLIFIIKKK